MAIYNDFYSKTYKRLRHDYVSETGKDGNLTNVRLQTKKNPVN